MIIIGVDCAAQDKNTGLALGKYESGEGIILDVKRGGTKTPVHGIIQNWISIFPEQIALLAFDSPLGWPEDLAKKLNKHNAGEFLGGNPDQLFSRKTDRIVEQCITRKRLLEVGANLIARTAWKALYLLNDLRKSSGSSIPLAWVQGKVNETSIIEVYPAGTVAARTGKKKSEIENEIRKGSLLSLEENVRFESSLDTTKFCDHEVDAVICFIAAMHFLNKKCIEPDRNEIEVIRKEGWIWVFDPRNI